MRIHARALLEKTLSQSPVDIIELCSVAGARRLRSKEMLLEGALIPTRDGRFDVVVRRDRPTTRRRFSAAHEVGHLLFYQHAPRSKTLQKQEGRRAPDEEERLCNIAAAELLMPTALVEHCIHAADDDASAAVIELAKTCNVSPLAAFIRLSRSWPHDGLLELWTCKSTWQRRYTRRLGSTWVRLEEYHPDHLRDTWADQAFRLHAWRRDGHLFHRERRASVRVTTRATPVTSGLKSQQQLLVHHHALRSQQRQLAPLGELEALRAHRLQAARRTKPLANCGDCRGTGWLFETANTVTTCLCRHRK